MNGKRASKVTISVRATVTDEVHRGLARLAIDRGLTLQDTVAQILGQAALQGHAVES